MIRASHTKTPRMLREATLTGIGFEPDSTPSPVFVLIGFFIGFLIGAIL